jgi:hypothetical protein
MRTEEGITAVTVVVGTEDESVGRRCGWSQQIMAPWSGQGKDFERDHLNGAMVLQGMQREHLGSLQGAAKPPPCGGCATALVYF